LADKMSKALPKSKATVAAELSAAIELHARAVSVPDRRAGAAALRIAAEQAEKSDLDGSEAFRLATELETSADAEEEKDRAAAALAAALEGNDIAALKVAIDAARDKDVRVESAEKELGERATVRVAAAAKRAHLFLDGGNLDDTVLEELRVALHDDAARSVLQLDSFQDAAALLAAWEAVGEIAKNIGNVAFPINWDFSILMRCPSDFLGLSHSQATRPEINMAFDRKVRNLKSSSTELESTWPF
jgi:hypothetical protein